MGINPYAVVAERGVGAIAAAIPTKSERAIGDYAKSALQRGAAGRGFGAAEYMDQTARARGTIEGEVGQRMASLARGSAMSGGASGVDQSQALAVLGQGAGMSRQAASDVRSAGLQDAASARASGLDATIAKQKMEAARKADVLSMLTTGMPAEVASAAGQEKQAGLAKTFNDAADAFKLANAAKLAGA